MGKKNEKWKIKKEEKWKESRKIEEKYKRVMSGEKRIGERK